MSKYKTLGLLLFGLVAAFGINAVVATAPNNKICCAGDATSGCNTCPCGITPCAGAVSATKEHVFSEDCIEQDESDCTRERVAAYVCATTTGYGLPNCAGDSVCTSDSTSTLGCE